MHPGKTHAKSKVKSLQVASPPKPPPSRYPEPVAISVSRGAQKPGAQKPGAQKSWPTVGDQEDEE